MKKFITLLLGAATFTGAFAQSKTTDEARRIILGDNRDVAVHRDKKPVYDNREYYPAADKKSVDKINREYDEKIKSIRKNKKLSNAEKDRIIRDLESQRRRAIQDNNRHYDDRKYKNNKHNNGKHIGWEKDKGNPHRKY